MRESVDPRSRHAQAAVFAGMPLSILKDRIDIEVAKIPNNGSTHILEAQTASLPGSVILNLTTRRDTTPPPFQQLICDKSSEVRVLRDKTGTAMTSTSMYNTLVSSEALHSQLIFSSSRSF